MRRNFTVPNLSEITKKTLKQLKNLSITQVKWYPTTKFGLTTSDGQTCLAGGDGSYRTHTFNPSEKITSVVCLIDRDEKNILKISFKNFFKSRTFKINI